jgi:peptidylprolyl isomerase
LAQKKEFIMAAKNGDIVKVHYTGTLDSGDIFDSSREREPLAFTIGEGKLIVDFEKTVIGMDIGETRTINIPAERAYGIKNDELIVGIPREHFPADLTPEKGQRFQANQPNGQVMPIVIVGVNETTITVDANHPLAGQDLTFSIELISIG